MGAKSLIVRVGSYKCEPCDVGVGLEPEVWISTHNFPYTKLVVEIKIVCVFVSLEKWLISWLDQGKYKMILECFMSGNKAVIKE